MSKSKHRFAKQQEQRPKSDNPIFGGLPSPNEPKADEPKADEPKADEPKADEPKADEPKADEPKADEPKADEPKADEPKIEMEPALRLQSRLGYDFWCCQQRIPKGRSLTLRLSELSEAQRLEIETKRKGKLITVEESELPKRG